MKPKFFLASILSITLFFSCQKDSINEDLSNQNNFIVKEGISSNNNLRSSLDEPCITIDLIAGQNDIVGTVALMPTKEKKVCELSKMAVMPKFRNKKIGQKILNEIICISKQMKLNKLILYSNRKLKNAINLYLKYGFKEVRLESTCHYKRADIKMSLSI